MNDTNKVIIVGRLTRDAELSYTSSGTALAKLGLAVNRNVKKGDKWEDEANFFDCVFWGKRAESLNQYLAKGQQIAVTGELKQERWEKDGNKRSRVVIHIVDLQLLGGGSKPQQEDYSPKTDKAYQATKKVFEEQIPF